MLHAALMGFPGTGKSTLFQLMTSARDSPHGKGDTAVGISKVPDARLDRLTAIFNPKKRVPATIEFTDIVAPGRTAASALVDVAGYKNADALVHVVRAFRDEAVPHPAGSVNPARDAQVMEDELILADLGVGERRLDRLEKDVKKSRIRRSGCARGICCCGAGTRSRAGSRCARWGWPVTIEGRLRGFQLFSAKPLLIVINLDEADVSAAASVEAAAGRRRG